MKAFFGVSWMSHISLPEELGLAKITDKLEQL